MSTIIPTLVIGIGGTGKAAVYDIRSRIISKLGKIENLKVINFLSLDTDFADPDLTDESLLADAVRLSANEQLYLQVPKTKMDEIKKGLQKHFPYYENWLESEALIKPHISGGAGQIRQLGRLAFYENFDSIVTALNTMASASVSEASIKATIDRGKQDVQKGVLNVYVIGSLIGGTGAGIFLDLGYLIEKVLVKSGFLGGINVIHMGIFVLPLGGIKIGETVDTRASTYAALLELNHYSDDETIFDITAPNNSRITSGSPPYKYSYLISCQNDTQSLNKTKLVQMLGQRVFMESTSNFSPQIRSNRDNLDRFLVVNDEKMCNQNYCTFGISTLEVPVQAVINSCAAMFLRDVFLELKKGKFADQVDRLAIDRDFVVRKLCSHDMGEQEMRKFLANLDGGSNISAFINNTIAQVDTLPLNTLIKELGKMEQDLDGRFLEKKGEGGDEGEFVRRVRINYETFIQKSEGLLAELISDLCNDPECRMVYASKFFSSMKSYYKELQEKYLRENQGLKDKIEKGKKSFDRAKNGAREILDDWLLLFWSGITVRDYLNRVYKAIIQKYLGLRVQYLINVYLLKIMEDINKTIDRIEKRLDTFTVYVDSLTDGYDKLIKIAKISFVPINGAHIYPMENTSLGLDDFVDETYKKTVGTESDKRKLINAFYAEQILPIIQKSSASKPDIFILHKEQSDKEDMQIRLYENAKKLISSRGKLEEIDVVKMFFNHYQNPDVMFSQIHSLSNPFLGIDKTAPYYDSNPGKSQHRVGFYGALKPQDEHQKKFIALSSTRIPNFDVTEGLGEIEEKYQVIFYQEYGAFPLRIWTQLEALKERYEHHLKTLNIPIHNEKRGFSYTPIDKASKKDIEEIEKLFLVANIPGINIFKVIDGKKGKLYQLDYFEGNIKRTLELRGEYKDIAYQLMDKKRDIQAIRDEIYSVRDEQGDEIFSGYIINYLNNTLREIYKSEEHKVMRERYGRLIEDYLEEKGLKEIAHEISPAILSKTQSGNITKKEIELKSEKNCPECNTLLPGDALFCSKCGYKYIIIKEEICPECKTSKLPDAVFCSKCGYKFIAEPEEEKIEFKFCHKCGEKLEATVQFCSKCGYKF